MKTSFLNKTYSGIRKTHFWKNTHVLEDICVFKNGFSKIVNIEVTTQNHLNARWRTLLNPLFQSKYPHLVNKLEYKSSSGKPKSRAYKRLKLGQNVFWKILDVYIAVTWFRSWEIFFASRDHHHMILPRGSYKCIIWNWKPILNNFCQTHWIFFKNFKDK